MTDDDKPGQRGLISRVLEPALTLWLRSQVERLDTLSLQIESRNRQILRGQVPRLILQAENAIYQGLHLSQVNIVAQNLAINIGQVLKGKPLQLLQPVPMQLKASILAEHLQNSLGSVLLRQAILESLLQLVGEQIAAAFEGLTLDPKQMSLQQSQLELGQDTLRLNTQLTHSESDQTVPVTLRTQIGLNPPSGLILEHPEWFPTPTARRGLPLQDLHGYEFDLGDQVAFETFAITPDALQLEGELLLVPENR